MKRKRLLLRISQEEFFQKLSTGVVGSASIIISSILLGFITTVLLSRMLGPAGFGLYVFANLIIKLVGIPLNTGLRSLLIREVARLRQKENWSELRGLLRRAFQAVITYSLLVLIVGTIVIVFLSFYLSRMSVATYGAALMIFPMIALMTIIGASLTGFKHVIWGQLPDMLIRPFVLVLILLAIYLFGMQGVLTPQVAMMAHLAAALFGGLAAAYIFTRLLRNKTRVASPVYQTRKWLESLVPLSLIGGISLLYTSLDVFMLGILKNHETVGIYRVASQCTILITFALQAVNMTIGPYVAQFYASGEEKRLQKLLGLSALVAFVTVLPIYIIYIFWGEIILGMIFGEVYKSAAITLIILGTGQMVNVSMGAVGLALNMTGHEKDTVEGTVIAAMLNGFLNFPMILYWGMEGAAMSTAISLSVWNVFLAWRLYKRIGILPFSF